MTGRAERTTWGSWSSTHRTGRGSEGQIGLWRDGQRLAFQCSAGAVCGAPCIIHIHGYTWPHTHTWRQTKMDAKSLNYTAKSVKMAKESRQFLKCCSHTATSISGKPSNNDEGKVSSGLMFSETIQEELKCFWARFIQHLHPSTYSLQCQ